MTEKLKEKVFKTYVNLFNAEPEFMIFAPGRVNLIGEHTDYSDGFVLPFAINLGIIIAFSPKSNDQINLYALDFDQFFEQSISTILEFEDGWKGYIKGVIRVLKDMGFKLKGFQGVVAGNLPIGAGLSSSAALEVAAVKTLCISSDIHLPNIELAKISQIAEREFVGVNVGIMDQLISAKGRLGHAVKLDCRTLETEYVPLPEGVAFVVLDTKTRRELSHSAYNTRHEEVDIAARILEVLNLRDATHAMLTEKKGSFPMDVYHRAKHVISENERVHDFVAAMQNNDLRKMGDLLNTSHESLRDDFDVSSKELNIIVDLAKEQPGCFGARMTGAGFGGCALAMIDQGVLDTFLNKVHHLYQAETNINPHIFKIESVDGVHMIDF
ncbi:MAG: galactokinase [Chloroflexota bacterium]|nr:galactokinase [Chloroflexota bacterium]